MKVRKHMKKVVSILLVLVMVLGLTACGSDKKEGKNGTDSGDGSPDAKQELNLVFTDTKTLDVNDVRNANEFQILSQVQEGLFRTFTDKDGKEVVENAGCESYEVSEDGLIYTFKIREQQWSDGEKITAQHYVDSIKRLLNPKLAFAYSFLAYDIKNATKYYEGKAEADEIGVKAVDESTLEITLEAAIPFFVKKLTNVCFFPIRTDIIESAGDSYANDYKKQVYNGPFIIKSRILENELVMMKNEKYWDAKNVKLEKVTFKVVAEPATQSLLLDSKELDAVVATTEYVNKWKAKSESGELVHVSKTAPSVNYMCFNQHTGGASGLMNNAKIRKALSLAVDRDEYNKLIYDGMNTPAYGLVPFGMMVGDKEYRSLTEEPLKKDAEDYNNNKEKLQALFQEGLKEEGKSDDLSKVELIFLSSGTTNQNKAEQEFFKQQYEEKLGIKIDLSVPADTSLFVTERDENRYDLVFMGWNGDYSDPMTFMELFNSGSGYAKYMGGYHNKDFDNMFHSLQLEADMSVREKTYIDMENNLIVENAGIAPYFYPSTQFFIQPYIKNMSLPTFGTQYEFSRAYISGKQ